MRKRILVAIGVPALVIAWLAFRPEKLWINQKVSEPAPFDTSGEPQPVLTGRFEDATRETSGRATIYKKAGGEEFLRLKDFMTPDAGEVHLGLAQSVDSNPGIDFGPLKSDQRDQDFDLPPSTDLTRYPAVVIYSEQRRAVIGWAKLNPF
jgi:hypothetical protein